MYDPRLLSTTPCTVKTFSIVGYNVVVILVRLFFYTTNKMCYISTRSFDKNGFDALSKKKNITVLSQEVQKDAKNKGHNLHATHSYETA